MTDEARTTGSRGSTTRAAARDVGRVVRLVIGAVMLVLLTLFVVVNTDDVTVGFLVGEVTLPLVVVLLVTAVLGGLISSLFFASRRRKR